VSILRRLAAGEAGSAIIESLVATTLLGLSLVFIVGTYSTMAISSRTAEQIAMTQATARAQAARLDAAPYQPTGNYIAYYEPLPTGPGVTRSVTVTWWDGTSAWVGSQNANGLQKVVLTITYDSKPVSTVEMVKANR
jgi:type II secretory pathway pseudopilin PulG